MRLYLIFIPCLVLANNHPRASPIEVLETYTEAFEPHSTLEIEGSYGALIIEGSSNTNVRLKLEKRTIKDYNLADHDHPQAEYRSNPAQSPIARQVEPEYDLLPDRPSGHEAGNPPQCGPSQTS